MTTPKVKPTVASALEGIDIVMLPGIFRPIGPSDDVVVSAEKMLKYVAQERTKAQVGEWHAILGIDYDKFYPTDNFNDFIKIPSFWINQQISEINMDVAGIQASLGEDKQ